MLCSRLCSRNPHCTPPTSVFLIISIVVYIFPLATHTNFIVLQGATKRFQFEMLFFLLNGNITFMPIIRNGVKMKNFANLIKSLPFPLLPFWKKSTTT